MPRVGFAKASLCLIAGALSLAPVTVAPAEPLTVESKTNLRAGPGAAFGVQKVLPAGAKLDVQRCSKTWCRVTYRSHAGYVSRSVLHPESNSYASAAPPAEVIEHQRPVRNGSHIWRWRDPEWRDRHWRRIEWHNRMKR